MILQLCRRKHRTFWWESNLGRPDFSPFLLKALKCNEEIPDTEEKVERTDVPGSYQNWQLYVPRVDGWGKCEAMDTQNMT